jgi:hypothetical protein
MSNAPFKKYARIGDLRKITGIEYQASIAMYINGFAEDAAKSFQAIKAHVGPDIAITAILPGEFDFEVLKSEIDERTYLIQIADGVGWGEAINALLKFAPSPYVIVMDPSTIFLGDAVTPVLEILKNGEYSAVGWRGGLINTEDEWRSVEDKGDGEVDVLFSYFMALNKENALQANAFNIRAVYYRNADIEFSLKLRQAQGRLLQLALPLEQARHHGYYDTDEAYRDEQSKKNYDRILDRFRGKNEILVPRR